MKTLKSCPFEMPGPGDSLRRPLVGVPLGAQPCLGALTAPHPSSLRVSPGPPCSAPGRRPHAQRQTAQPGTRQGLHVHRERPESSPDTASPAVAPWLRSCFLLGASSVVGLELKVLFEVARHRHAFLGTSQVSLGRPAGWRVRSDGHHGLVPVDWAARAAQGERVAASLCPVWCIKGYLSGRPG